MVPNGSADGGCGTVAAEEARVRVRWFAPVALALSLLFPAGAAQAQSDEDKAAARSLWSQATESLAAGKFEETIDLATRAEALVHAPTHVILIARGQAKLGRLVAARESYLKIIREDLPATAPGAFKKAQQEAKDELAAIEPRIASLKVALEGAGGRKIPVKIDEQQVPDALVGVYRPIDPGQHKVTAFPPGLKPVEGSVSLGDGEKKELSLKIPEGPLPPGVPVSATDNPDQVGGPTGAPPPPPPDSGGTSPLTWVGLGVGGLGLVGVGVGVTFLVIGGGTQSDADSQFDTCAAAPGGCTAAQQADIEQLDSDAASQKTIGVIGLAAGGALIAGGAVLTAIGLTSKPKSPSAGWVMPYVTPGGLGVRGAF